MQTLNTFRVCTWLKVLTVYNKSVHALRKVFGELSTGSLFSVSKQDADEFTYGGCVCCAEAKLLLVSGGFVVDT